VILSSLLVGVFGFPADLVLVRMVPGTALGVLVGDLVYTWLALRLMRRTGRDDVTAMPFGIDTPTLFAMVFGVLGPVKLATGDPVLAWKVGMACTLAIGVVKALLAFAGDWTRRAVPRAALLGSIAGVAILLIAFLPALKLYRDPLVGLVALGVLFVALLGGVRMPFGVPGALAAVAAGTAVHWLRDGGGHGWAAGALAVAVPWPTLAWTDALDDALPYLSIALPFALVTTIGGIDNTESAAAAGDEYRTRDILLTEAAVAPILVYVGLEITAQAFLASPPRHGAAVAVTFVPVAAAVVLIELGGALGALGKSAADLTGDAAHNHRALLVLGNGFILTAVLWGSALAWMIDRRLLLTAVAFAAASLATLFGVIHSPLPSGALFWPWSAGAPREVVFPLAGAYGVLAGLCAGLATRRST
jgi:AGZA family xanthine/uracil permease-like MFS transporter